MSSPLSGKDLLLLKYSQDSEYRNKKIKKLAVDGARLVLEILPKLTGSSSYNECNEKKTISLLL